ncbi:MAG: hypothetical protein V3T08_06370, partial [Gemmatimonadota bacterium]
AFSRSCALVSRADRVAVAVTGERAAEMLDGLLSNDVASLAGVGRHAFLLTVKGRVLADLRLFPRPDGLLIDVPEAALENVVATFRKYLPPMYARFEDLSGSLDQIGVYGPRAAEVVAQALDADVPGGHLEIRWLEVDQTEALAIRSQRLAGDGVELVAGAEAAATLWNRLAPVVADAGGRTAGRRALEAARVEWGIPRYGVDMDDSTLAPETGLEAEAISYEKGCYLGQEVIARIHFRGHVNRFLRSLEFDGGLPDAGAHLFSGEKDVGVVTSAVHTPEFGPIGLGYVRREVEAGKLLRWSQGEREGRVKVRERPPRPAPAPLGPF